MEPPIIFMTPSNYSNSTSLKRLSLFLTECHQICTKVSRKGNFKVSIYFQISNLSLQDSKCIGFIVEMKEDDNYFLCTFFSEILSEESRIPPTVKPNYVTYIKAQSIKKLKGASREVVSLENSKKVITRNNKRTSVTRMEKGNLSSDIFINLPDSKKHLTLNPLYYNTTRD